MGKELEEFEDFNLETFELPPEFYHSTQRGNEPPKPERFGIDLSTPSRRWEDWVVKLTFEKLGKKHGNGFYVNVPNATFDVVLTAGHNLVEKEEQYCSNIRILNDPFKKNDITVTPEMIRVCQRYFEDPDELNAIYDYGVILLKRDKKDRVRGFGFNLMLGIAPLPGVNTDSTEDEEKDLLYDRDVYVSGYTPGDSPYDDPPRRSEGKCIRTNSHQLQYKADAMQGMSGGPVWIGFRGVETVVAVHNYGAENKGQGNRGSRLNLNVWRTVFEWVGVGWHGKSLHYRGSPTYSMHLYLPQNYERYSATANEGRVRIGKPGLVDTLFDILPVAAKPKAKELDAGYGFLLRPNAGSSSAKSPLNWVRWDPKKDRVSLTRRFDGRCEVKIPQLIVQPGKPFAIQAQDEDSWKQVRMDMKRLDEGDLKLLGEDPKSYEDTSEISFVPLTRDKPFELK
ncbi:hypothetical protein F4776DRAFT_673916 [Hypoxylon sp. NC0597]|nr:hypothetical protein F4776DRAFT_673916 [Hypoxylon sp. NC0597]